MQGKRITTKQLYICFVVLSVLPSCLIFSESIWFDEAYTVSLIKHSFKDMLRILNTDMHPPLYFLSLKVFCSVFGYSLISTKIFSLIGYVLTLLSGPTVIKATFSSKVALVFMLVVGAIPMTYYFSVQQRSYSYCILFVTLSFVFAVRFLRNYMVCDALLMSLFVLLASYNHTYALLTCGIIFAFVNITVIFRNKKQMLKIILADAIVIAGYLPRLFILFSQIKKAASDFWLTGVEPLSIFIFIIGILICIPIVIKQKSLEVLFAAVTVLSVQAIGLFTTVLIRPFYIARYSVVVLGVFALLIGLTFKTKLKKGFCLILCLFNLVSFTLTLAFEYDSSLINFVERFDKVVKPTDSVVYLDSSFGIVSYYFPENVHICTYREEWFDAFENVKSIKKNAFRQEVDAPCWLIKNTEKQIPKYITKDYNVEKTDSFRSDFNTFDVYKIQPK